MKDNFSRQADDYAKYRPTYPKELFEFIVAQVKNRKIAWDCGTGNGQTAKELAAFFEKVFATDISQKQLDNATASPRIIYSLQPAEQTDFPSRSIDLITVSQALHWFKFDEFYEEVNRVAAPGAIIAVWTYSRLGISPEIDRLINIELYKNTLGGWWDKERKYVDENYATLPFPFQEIKTPLFNMQFQWKIEEMEGYLNTWSALQKYILAKQHNPVDELIKKMRPFWGKGKRDINFALHLRLGTVDK